MNLDRRFNKSETRTERRRRVERRRALGWHGRWMQSGLHGEHYDPESATIYYGNGFRWFCNTRRRR